MNKIGYFLKQGIKGLKRERFFALVNILGLSLGMFCFLVSSLYVKDELTHDKWHKNAERIYLPQQSLITGNGSINLMPSYAIGPAWKAESPGVLDVVNISFAKSSKYTVNGVEYNTDELFYSSSALFTVFDFSLKFGDEMEALEEPNGIVVSHEMARKHFRSQNPLGEFIDLEGLGIYQVTGVLDKIPSNSHLQFEFIIPIDFTKGDYKDLETNWQFGSGLHYLLLAENYSIQQLSEDTKALLKKNKDQRSEFEFTFNKFSELYLKGRTVRNTSGMFGGQEKYIIIFSIVGVLMLLVASFNYINLTTSRSFSRAKDLVVRKILGASRGRLVRFQLGETLFVAILALILTIISLEGTLPSINNLIGKNLSLDIGADPSVLFLPIAVLLIVVLLSGIYPALVASKFNLADSLKGNSPKAKGTIIRKSLMVLQFAICTGVLASALVIRYQANYMIEKDLGYNTQNLISIDLRRGNMYDKKSAFKSELERSSQIELISSGPIPSSGGALIMDIGEGEEKTQQFISFGSADTGFIKIGGMEMVAGSDFSAFEESQLENAVMINEAALNLFGLDIEDAINQVIPNTKYKLVGVIKDYHFSSTKSKISPLLINYDLEQISNLLLRFKAGNKDNVIAHAQTIWDDLGATEEFKYNLIETHFDDAFEREEALVSIFDGLTVMLILIASLGLFGLSVFESQLKEKEMSIRKVLGASQLMLIQYLNRNFLFLIGFALVIAVPVTQYMITGWLEDFPYRIESTYSIFAISCGIVLGLALLMLTFQGVRTARKNPVDVLRNE